MEHSAQGKRSGTLGLRVLEQSRPVRAKALSYGAVLEQNIHTLGASYYDRKSGYQLRQYKGLKG